MHLQNPEGHDLEEIFNLYKADLDFLGPEIEKETVQQIAKCEINPENL